MFRAHAIPATLALAAAMTAMILASQTSVFGLQNQDQQIQDPGRQKGDHQNEGTGQAYRKQGIPPFYADPAEVKEIPKTLPPENFENPITREAYQVARENPRLLLQLPCFCPCDLPEVGHKSLLDCFVDSHAESCVICRGEALDAARLQKENWSIEKIREKIIADYSKVHH